jgi:hypothetical protein
MRQHLLTGLFNNFSAVNHPQKRIKRVVKKAYLMIYLFIFSIFLTCSAADQSGESEMKIPLSNLKDFNEFRNLFKGDSGKVRLISLLSPV